MQLRRLFDKIGAMKINVKNIIFMAAALSCVELFALPDAANPIPDASGEYVYYRDFSFNRESYIGFLCYDDSTYEARYYAPATETLAAKNIDLLFSAEQKNGRLEMTGERFVVPPQQDDAAIVNYIHDLVYELSGRRAKLQEPPLVDYEKAAAPFMQAGVVVSDDYEAFGGSVQMLYDEAVPIFNLKKIVDYSGRDVFVAVAIGKIESSKDSSFAEFVPAQNGGARKPFQIKNAKKETLSFRAEVGKSAALFQSVQADKNWSLAGQSLWTLGDSAIVSLQTLALPEGAADSQAQLAARLLRLFALSKGGAYCDLSALDVHAKGTEIKISSRTYNPKSKKAITDIKALRAAAKNFYGCFSLAVYTDDYQANRGYFDKLAKSYVCKMEN